MELNPFNDDYFMRQAFIEAQKAFDKDEVPVGAVISCENKIIARAHNMTETLKDPTAHAEMQVFTAASAFLGGRYLTDCTLYVTLEPCLMCAGASFWVQIGKIVFGAPDKKKGISSISSKILHPKTKVVSGVMEKECNEILTRFFQNKRFNTNLN